MNPLTHPPFQGYNLTMFNLVTSILTMVLSYAIAFFITPYIVSHLGVEANGFTQLAHNFVTYAGLVTLAFGSMTARFILVSYHRGDVEQACRYYTSGYFVNLFFAALGVPLALYVIINLQDVVRIETADPGDVRILFGCVFFNFLWSLATSVVGSAEYVKNAVYVQNFVSLLTAFSQSLLAVILLGVLPVRVFYVALASSVVSVLIFPLRFYIQRRLLAEVRVSRRYFSLKAIFEMFKSGVWNTVNQCGHMLNTGFDLLMANIFISPVAMGVLAISKTVPNALILLVDAVNGAFSPSVTAKWARGDHEAFKRELTLSMKVSSIVVSIPIVTFCCFASAFYHLWVPGEDAHTLTIASILTIFPFIPFAGTQALYNIFTATNKLVVNSIAFVVGGVLNVGVVYVALSHNLANGIYIIAGTSSVLTMIRIVIVVLPYASRILGLRWCAFYKDVITALICAVLNLAVGLTIVRIVDINSWLELVACGLVTAVAAFFIEVFVVLNREARTVLFNNVLKKWRK